MNNDVFGEYTYTSAVSPTPVENENGEPVITCELGKCGMTYYNENNR